MSKHDSLYIKKFQPKGSDTPVMDVVYDLLKIKDRHRKHLRYKKHKRIERAKFDTWF